MIYFQNVRRDVWTTLQFKLFLCQSRKICTYYLRSLYTLEVLEICLQYIIGYECKGCCRERDEWWQKWLILIIFEEASDKECKQHPFRNTGEVNNSAVDSHAGKVEIFLRRGTKLIFWLSNFCSWQKYFSFTMSYMTCWEREANINCFFLIWFYQKRFFFWAASFPNTF